MAEELGLTDSRIHIEQMALLVFRAPNGEAFVAAAVLGPMRAVGSGEYRGYSEGEALHLESIRLVDAPEPPESAEPEGSIAEVRR